ncbi:alpha/beta fold hydrolase [Flavihumibacter fluvii]|uniref:alpha/beta fold hydrolase n=1 Tax=Flavihumibacter fluvii TaxID=2838157 RepID=UPI001BDEB32E|nr:alpha/beta hydrolase [Flavihumibacter fluvii]ULQ50895.1 alpha/beta hydrolase [Flavihumibacter fluvii]
MKIHLLSVVTCLCLLFMLDACTSTAPITRARNKVAIHAISEMNDLMVNNWKQFVLIRGADTTRNPVLLFLHGGPGASGTPLMRTYNKDLEQDFTVVYWDQRGAGKSYSKEIDTATLKVKQLIADANYLIDYLRQRFHQEKIFVIGHSWGSRLGMYLVKAYPEKIKGYIGIGQEVAAYEGELRSYQFTLEKAKATNNKAALKDLAEMGEPQSGQVQSMYKTGFWGTVQQKEWLLKLGGERYNRTSYTDWLFQMLWSDEYSLSDMVNWVRASAATAGKMIEDPDFNGFDLRKDIPAVQLPVYFISGLHDYNTPWPLVKQYYEQLQAPKKEFFLFEQSGHSVLFEEPGKFNDLVVRLFLDHND